jgi:hypothetical protein
VAATGDDLRFPTLLRPDAENDVATIERAMELCEVLPDDCRRLQLWCRDRVVIQHRTVLHCVSSYECG